MTIHARYPDSSDQSRWKAVEICLKCGVCCNVEHGCHVMFDSKFNPLYTFVYDCLVSDRGVQNPNIWLCVSCHKCEESCPYEVSPINFIEALKAKALSEGCAHPVIRAELNQIITTSFAFPLTASTERQRQALNLGLLTTHSAADLQKIAVKTGLAYQFKEA